MSTKPRTTKAERLYRSRLRKIVQRRLEPTDDDKPRTTQASLARACFPRENNRPHDRASTAVAVRKLQREMGVDPSGRASAGIKWGTLEAICSGLGCSFSDLLG